MLSPIIQELSDLLRAEPPLKPAQPDGSYSRVSDLSFYENLPRLVDLGMGVPLVLTPGSQGVNLMVRLVQYQINISIYVTTENREAFLLSLKERIVKTRGLHDMQRSSDRR